MTYRNNVIHPPFCKGCEACQPSTPEQREAERQRAERRVAAKRHHRLVHAVPADWCPACIAIEEMSK